MRTQTQCDEIVRTTRSRTPQLEGENLNMAGLNYSNRLYPSLMSAYARTQ